MKPVCIFAHGDAPHEPMHASITAMSVQFVMYSLKGLLKTADTE